MISKDLAKHLFELSKLGYTDDELNKMQNDMTDIVMLMDKIKDFDGNTEEAVLTKEYDSLRNDIPSPSASSEDILRNAKAVSHNSFSVPKII